MASAMQLGLRVGEWVASWLLFVWQTIFGINFRQGLEPGNKRKVVVTGAASGIGLATAKELNRLGFTVIVCDSNASALEASWPNDNEQSVSIIRVVADVTDAKGLYERVKKANGEQLDDLYGYVSMPGIVKYAPTALLPEKALREVFEVTLFGTFLPIQRFHQHIVANKGRIVLTGSLSSRVGDSFNTAYTMSKASVAVLAARLHEELGLFGVHVALVEPGPVDTPPMRAVSNYPVDQYKNTPYYPWIKDHLNSHSRFDLFPVSSAAEMFAHAIAAKKPYAYYIPASPLVKLATPIYTLFVPPWVWRKVQTQI